MKIAVLSVTEQGKALAHKITRGLTGHKCAFVKSVQDAFYKYDAIIFVCAAGIAVRKIVPFVKSKLSDPAVVVCDDAGTWAVSLLSGHIGGANRLAEEISAVTGAAAVITTASDVSDIPKKPENIVVGIGCRRGASAETIERAVTTLLWREKIPMTCVCSIASSDIKSNEQGLLRFARLANIPAAFYSAEQLNKINGNFTRSDFVRKTTGVDNVCERAAVLRGLELFGKGRLIMRKTAADGVTAAAFEGDTNAVRSRNWSGK